MGGTSVQSNHWSTEALIKGNSNLFLLTETRIIDELRSKGYIHGQLSPAAMVGQLEILLSGQRREPVGHTVRANGSPPVPCLKTDGPCCTAITKVTAPKKRRKGDSDLY